MLDDVLGKDKEKKQLYMFKVYTYNWQDGGGTETVYVRAQNEKIAVSKIEDYYKDYIGSFNPVHKYGPRDPACFEIKACYSINEIPLKEIPYKPKLYNTADILKEGRPDQRRRILKKYPDILEKL